MTKMKKTTDIPAGQYKGEITDYVDGYHVEGCPMVVAYKSVGSSPGWTLSVICRSDAVGGRQVALAISYADRLKDLRETAEKVAKEIKRTGLEPTMKSFAVANALLEMRCNGDIPQFQ